MDKAEAKKWLEESHVKNEQMVHANIDFLAELLTDYANSVSRKKSVEFAKWYNEAGFIAGQINDKLYDEWLTQTKEK